MEKMESLLKAGKQSTLALISCLMLTYPLLSLPRACAQEQPSLIESALEGKLDLPPTTPPVPVSKKVGSPLSIKTGKPPLPKETTAKTEAKTDKQKDNAKVTLTPPSARESSETFPEPSALIEQPIHSAIPYHQPKVPILDIRVGSEKVDKSHAIDPIYRGKPALPVVPSVTFGKPTWAIPARKQIAVGAGAAPVLPAPAAVPKTTMPVNITPSATPTQTAQLYEINVRIMTDEKFKKTDTLWAYPYPPKPPKTNFPGPLPEGEGQLKSMILSYGYTYRPDLTRPYPPNGWRWVKAFDNAMRKARTGYPHTMLTMYPWVNKMFPYVRSECREINLVEEKRAQHYELVMRDYEKAHIDIESLATSHGLIPVEIKVNGRGIAQVQLPSGNWWITCTRAYPGLKFYWQEPVSCAAEKVINVQLNEANALIIAGGW